MMNQLTVKKNPVRVPVLALTPRISCDKIDLYGFHSTLSPMFDGDDRSHHGENILAKPFATITSCPRECNFVSHQGHIFVVGGTLLSRHHVHKLEEKDYNSHRRSTSMTFEEIVETIDDEYLAERLASLPHRNYLDIVRCYSDRMTVFRVQNFLDTTKDRPETSFFDLTNKTSTFTYSQQLSKPMGMCHILCCNETLYSLGGFVDFDRHDHGCFGDVIRHHDFLQSYSNGEWCSVPFDHSILDNSYCSMSAAIGGSILIGLPNKPFILLDLNSVGGVSVKYLDIKVSEDFVLGCSEQPGIVVDNRLVMDDMIVVWHDGLGRCIRGLHLRLCQWFSINYVYDGILIVDYPDDETNVDSAQLIGFGDGTLGMIYTGRESYVHSIDEQGFGCYLRDHRFVMFELIIDYLAYHVEVETRIISTRKFYAPRSLDILTAFMMDVCLPSKVENESPCFNSSTKETGAGAHTILEQEEIMYAV